MKAKGANGIRYPSSLSCKLWILNVKVLFKYFYIKVNTLNIPPE